MHSSKKGEQMYFGIKATWAQTPTRGLVHTVGGTSGNVHGVIDDTGGNSLLHGHQTVVFADAGYQCIEKRADATPDVTWHVAMRPGKGRALSKGSEEQLMPCWNKQKSSKRAFEPKSSIHFG